MTQDFRPIILEAFTTLKKREIINNEPFKVKAYENVLNQIEEMGPIYSMEDLEYVKGIGKKIKAKLEEIFSTGQLESANIIMKESPIVLYDELLNIYGIGAVKARELIENEHVVSIADLQEKVKLNPDLITKASRIGLEHYYDFQKRIPREEMEIHDEILQDTLPKNLVCEIVGSYRRGLSNSGDVDVLVTSKSYNPENIHTELRLNEFSPKQIAEFHNYIYRLKELGYITNILSLGKSKCLAVCKVDSVYRRIDLLLTPDTEFAYAKLYFTGSKEFNVAMRSYALKLGWSLNEHTLQRINAIGPYPGFMEDEEDIFDFLHLEYVEPEDRKDDRNLKEI
jgi:DNA polymerase/3'-5' exonuclease PolX